MTASIQRRFAAVSGRWGQRLVHYRVAGAGPPLLLLHQSPQSSRELVPLMEQWAVHFTVIAPDSPGYGLSDPLGVAEAGLDDFAAATLEFADTLGLDGFAVYGFHTGGMIGLALADTCPRRIRALACNGVLLATAAERESMLRDYLPPLEPRWDGGHLAWLWGRIREQAVFFPWHRRCQASRMDFPMPGPERLQAAVLEFLRAAGHYQVAYRAAFIYRADDVVQRLRVPTLITAAAWDPLFAHLARLPAPAAGVTVARSAGPAEAMARCLDHLRAATGPAGAPLALPEPVPPDPGRVGRAVLRLPQGPLLIRRGGASAGLPVLVLHDAGGSSRTVEWLWSALAPSRPVLAPDLPGHGESDLPPGSGDVGLGRCAREVLAALEVLGLPQVAVVGAGAGGLVGLELLAAAPGRVAALVLLDPPVLDSALRQAWREQGLPSLAADWHGGHLSRCWHMVRDGRLYFPWFRRDQQGIRRGEPDLDDQRIQLEVTEYLKAEGAWQSLRADALDYPLGAGLAAARGCTAVAAVASGPWYGAAAALAESSGCRFHPLPEGAARQAAALLALLPAAPRTT